MDRSSVCPRQVSRFYASGKAMILQQVPLLPSIKLNQHSGAVFDYIFLFLLASAFLDSSRIVRPLNVFVVTGPIQAPIFACSPFLTYKINLVVDPSEIFFSASSKKAWKINVICINLIWPRQGCEVKQLQFR